MIRSRDRLARIRVVAVMVVTVVVVRMPMQMDMRPRSMIRRLSRLTVRVTKAGPLSGQEG